MELPILVRDSCSSSDVAGGPLAASLMSILLVLLSSLEEFPILGDVSMVPHFLHLLIMAVTVFNDASNVLEICLYSSHD